MVRMGKLDFGAADDRVDIPEIGESSEEATFAFWVFRKIVPMLI